MVAECGHTAVEAIEAFTFDVVIVDIFMPGMNGLETIKVFRARCAERADHRDVGLCGRQWLCRQDFFRTAMEFGATCCLRKPFTREQLLDAIAFCRASKSALVA